MKRWVKGLTAAGVAALLTVPAFAAFSDVPENAWYAADVEAVQEYGIINGVGDNRFDPDGTLTIAEALTMAVRTNARHNGTEVPAAEGAWYQGAVNYATENGMISGTEFADYNANATRAQMAYLFANALPESEYTAINDVTALPDVKEQTQYSDEIFLLYNAGILTGSDKYGTFKPNDTIIRAEAAAIINRVVDSSKRKAVEVNLDTEEPEGTEGLSPLPDCSNIGEYTDAVYPKEGDILNGVKVTRDPITGVLGYGNGQKGGIYLGIKERLADGSYRTIEVGTRAIDTYDGMSAGNTYTQIGDYIFWDGEWGKIISYVQSKMPTASAKYVGKCVDINGNIVEPNSGATILFECKYDDVLGIYSWYQTF
ncbi:S-layer homology domain-containing protein [Agathobaculum sp. Marseille-P7918]|uniref:S-layer homology domain-containing protein n=1 Tax=Agathobaculum sp. Marseille-P7918 TaxID=2479843 RepID=UPI00356225F8